MIGHHLPVVVAKLLQQSRGALDVGEQEGDGAARKSHAVTVQRRETALQTVYPKGKPPKRGFGIRAGIPSALHLLDHQH